MSQVADLRRHEGDNDLTGQFLMITPSPRDERTHVVILGGGYAGLIAANRLLGSLTQDEVSRIKVTVVNPRPDFVERIRLHELAAGARDRVTIPLVRLLHQRAELLVGSATRIECGERRVSVVVDGKSVEVRYDYLVYAVGSVAAEPMPGAREHAFLLSDFDDASAAAVAIAKCGQGDKIAVIGGGFTGVEAATELVEQHPDADVTLFCAGKLVPSMRSSARKNIGRVLRRGGVRLVEDAPVAAIKPYELVLTGGATHEFDVCLVAASFDVPDLAAASGLPVDAIGRLRVDETLRCVEDQQVIGAGDAIVAPSSVAGHLRMSCAAALPLGGHAAVTLLAAIRGDDPAPLSVGFLIQCLSLGRKKGYVQVVRADDRPRSLHVGGRAGARIKETVCSMTIDSAAKESRKPGAYWSPRGPKAGASA
jgi:NADH dehydrogenase FAD-containing subunit